MDLHPDFAGIDVTPGAMELAASDGPFDLVNLIQFGGAPDRPPHVPETVGRVGDVVLWESTGASDALPFWNTNYQSDVYLFLIYGDVRVEFKEPETERRLGHYLGRTGDLMRLPYGIAHRTFSSNGKRRISLEVLAHNPAWDSIGAYADVAPAPDLELPGVRFGVEDGHVTIATPFDTVSTPSDLLARGLRALIAYELHLDHNEFEGGFVVHDQHDHVRLKTPGGYDEPHDRGEVLATFKELARQLAQTGQRPPPSA